MLVIDSLPILRWAHGGDAVGVPATGPLAGMVVFVPGAVPGDVVRVRVSERAARFARAEVLAIETPSAERVAAPCEVQAACGGCPWMIGSAAAQQASREAILAGEVRKRLGDAGVDVALEVRPSGPAFGYRQRVRWTYADRQVGYVARGSHRLVPIRECAVADPRLTALLPMLREALPAGESGKVTLLAGAEGVAGWIQPAATPGRVFLRDAVSVRFGEAVQLLSPRSFVQANPFVTGQILDDLRRVVRAARGGDGDGDGDADANAARIPHAFELFAGSGTLTQALWAEGYRVTAYEVDAGAAAAFHATREGLGVAPERGRWCTNDLLVTGVPERLPGHEGPPDLVLLDPPRTGAKALVPWLRGTMARTVVYVSCDLATALRDVSELAGRGATRRYDVTRLIAYDMFPHTGHQELMLVLTRRGALARDESTP